MNLLKQRMTAMILAAAVALSMCFTPVTVMAQDSGTKSAATAFRAAPVTELSAKSKAYNKIELSWSDWDYENDGYDIYRSTKSSGTYQRVKRIYDWEESWTDTKVKTGSRYYYKIKSFAVDYEEEEGNYLENGVETYSSFSKTVSAVPKLSKPTLSAKTAGKTKVKLTWKKVSGASGYKIYKYNTKKKKYTAVKTIKNGSAKSWTNSKLKAGKKVKYKIKAYRNVGKKKVYSDFSKVKSATPKAKTKAKEKAGGGTVYITRTGAKFHRGSCHYLSRSKISILRSKAIAQGYKACKVCRP